MDVAPQEGKVWHLVGIAGSKNNMVDKLSHGARAGPLPWDHDGDQFVAECPIVPNASKQH